MLPMRDRSKKLSQLSSCLAPPSVAVCHTGEKLSFIPWQSNRCQASVFQSSLNRKTQLSTTIETTVNRVLVDVCNNQSPPQETSVLASRVKAEVIVLMIDWVSMGLHTSQVRGGCDMLTDRHMGAGLLRLMSPDRGCHDRPQ